MITSPTVVQPGASRPDDSGDSGNSSNGSQELVVVGRLQSPHGVRGWIKFRSFTEDPELALTLQPWLLGDPAGRLTSIELEQYRSQGEFFVLKFKGTDDRNAAALLTGRSVQVRADQLPVPGEDEYYWRDLEGMEVCNAGGVALGKAVALFNNGAHDVLVVRDASRERLIPFVDRHVQDVDLDRRLITVDWDEAWD